MYNQQSSNEGIITSGENISYWIDSVKPIGFETLNQHIETDILIIGGGIAGLTTAYCLLKAGRQVTLVEDGLIGSGETGRTTAHLTCALDDRYYEIEKVFDQLLKLDSELFDTPCCELELGKSYYKDLRDWKPIEKFNIS